MDGRTEDIVRQRNMVTAESVHLHPRQRLQSEEIFHSKVCGSLRVSNVLLYDHHLWRLLEMTEAQEDLLQGDLTHAVILKIKLLFGFF